MFHAQAADVNQLHIPSEGRILQFHNNGTDTRAGTRFKSISGRVTVSRFNLGV